MEQMNYPGFEYAASQLSAYALSIDTFVISLKNGQMAHFHPKDVEDFRKWLMKHRIRDINIDNGIPKNVFTELSQKKAKRRQ